MTVTRHASPPTHPRRRARIASATLLLVGALALGVQAGGTARAGSVPVSVQQTYFSATVLTPFTGTVVTFDDGNSFDTASSFQVTSIVWGDKTEGTGTVLSTNGGFAVQASHTYRGPGRFPLTITLSDAGTSFTLTSTAIVSTCPSSGTPFGPYAQAVLGDAPLGYWRLDDAATSGCVVDSSGNGLNGTPTGGITANQPGAFTPFGDSDTATAFDGATGYISLGDPAALQPSQLSVEAWVHTTHPGGIIVRKRFYGYGLALNSAGDPLFGIDDSNAVSYNATGSASVADGTWHYLVGTYDGAQVCLYVDGVQATCAAAAPIYYQPDLVAIGRDGGASDSYFNGQLNDVAIYGTALLATQVQAHYRAGTRYQTSTALSISPTTVTPGQPFTLTATVQSAGSPVGMSTFCTTSTASPGAGACQSSPSGTVTFCAASTSNQAYCWVDVPPTSPGGATFTLAVGAAGAVTDSYSWTSSTPGGGSSTTIQTGSPATAITLPAGSYRWTAAYSGDASNLPSTSALATLVITQAPTTIGVTSSAGSATASQAVTFTATVQGVTPRSVTPTGTVIFIEDGTVVLGSGAVGGSGTATLTAGTLGIGTHSITAIYGGDGSYSGSIAPALSQTITPA